MINIKFLGRERDKFGKYEGRCAARACFRIYCITRY